MDGHNDLPWALREAGSPEPDLAPTSPRRSSSPTPTCRGWPQAASAASSGRSTSRPSCQGDAAVAATIEQVDLVRQLVARYPDRLELALTAAAGGVDHGLGQAWPA